MPINIYESHRCFSLNNRRSIFRITRFSKLADKLCHPLKERQSKENRSHKTLFMRGKNCEIVTSIWGTFPFFNRRLVCQWRTRLEKLQKIGSESGWMTLTDLFATKSTYRERKKIRYKHIAQV